MLIIDGAMGEGGGQILRSSLALSLCLGRPFRIINIRAARKKPGLRRQHLAAVMAAAQIARAGVNGAALGSRQLSFVPGRIEPGSYRFSIGTAGSTTLVLQTVLPALWTAGGPSDLLLEGGTHNPLAPPYNFLVLAYLPLLVRMGAVVSARLERPGFYPAGGGRVRLRITPVPRLQPLAVTERGAIREMYANAVVANLPRHIAQRELQVIGRQLGLDGTRLRLREESLASGPGNLLTVVIRSESVTEVFTGFGRRGVPAEAVAARLAGEVRRYLTSGVPVGEYLADQLLLPLALAGGGAFRTLRPSGHTMTNIAVLKRFMEIPVVCEKQAADDWCIRLG